MRGYQLKIIIKNSKPPIWRRVVVPEGITFDQLHQVIQAVYGWQNRGPYIFEIPQKKVFIGAGEQEISSETEMIDSWAGEHKWIRYTYGADIVWEHRVEIEKTLDNTYSFPRVEKYKGANLPEDCGGIQQYYEWLKTGQTEEREYTLESVNQYLEEHLGLNSAASAVNEVLEELPSASGEYHLMEWLQGAHQEELTEIARLNHLAAYQNLTKEELAVQLAELLLNEAHMAQLLLYAGGDEYRIFKEIAESQEGCRVDLNFVYRSRLLRSYCILTREASLVIPEEAREIYQRIVTAEFTEKQEEIETLRKYCSSANYLYGVTPVSLLTRLYQQYEHANLGEEAIRSRCLDLMNNDGPVTVIGDNIICNELLDQDAYRMLLLLQGSKPFYIPPVRGLFLQYGAMYGEAPEKEGQELIRYVKEELQAGQAQANSYFYEVQALIHKNYEMNDLIAAASKYNIAAESKAQMAGLTERLHQVWNHTRRLGDRGYTPLEIENLQKKKVPSAQPGKMIPVQKNQKIYPNAPCPCGSGKKYKKCCGR